MGPCNFMAPLLYLILTFSFAQAQNDCPLFTETLLGSADELSSTGLVGDAFRATSGDPSQISVQVHAAHIVCLRSGRTRDTFSGVSVIVNYTCIGPPSECTGNPILSQFEFECVGTSWSASVGGSASNIITTPPSGTFSTPRRSDCGVCLSPMRASFGGITNNSQHCGSCNSACSSGLMRCFNRVESGCCNYYENDLCVANCTSPRVPNVNFDCVLINHTCHDTTGCGGSMVTGVSTVEECCLGSGLSFRNGSGVCRQCIVHGFETTDFVLDEGATQEVIRVILDVKGDTRMEPASTRILNFDFSFTCTDSSNGGGPQAADPGDYTDTGCGSNIQLRLFPSSRRTSEVGVSALADDKIEGTEFLMQQLTLTSPTQDAVDNAGNIFFQNASTITIIDVTEVVIGFSEDDYTGDEGEPGDLSRPNSPCTVVVELIERTLEIPLQIQLTPTARNATVNDFNATVIVREIPAAQTQLMQAIQIFDDDINEARETFEVALQLVSNISNVVNYRRRTTLCRIRQSDPIEIGFTLRRINHIEDEAQFDTIVDKSLVSEQTFFVQIEISTLTSPFGQSATQGEDFVAGTISVVVRELAPGQDNISFSYRIIEDNTPENQEVFQLSVTPAINSPAFSCSEANGCFQQLEIVIQDDDVVVVGFVDTLVEVNETDGQATLNVSISSPAPHPTLAFEIMFSLSVDSMDGSAGSQSAIDTGQTPPIAGVEDFPQIADGVYYIFDNQEFSVLNAMFNGTRRSQIFTFPIFVDDVPEGVEELQLTLSLRADPTLPQRSVNVTPAVATVRIHDFSSVVVGFERSTYTVGEGDGQVELCVNITMPRRQNIGTTTFNLTVETQDGSAVSPDDYTSVSMTLGPFTSQRPRQCFDISIMNDASVEPTEDFTTSLTLIPASVTTITADRIIVNSPEATVQITDNDLSPTTPPTTTTAPPLTPVVRVNGTVTGDPLMTVPLNIGNDTRILLGPNENERVSLCYEVHGEANENFNLVSDVCVSVNAHYTRVRSDVDINVINRIGVRAVDGASQCHNITADLNGCRAFVDGVEITTSYRMGGISVHKYPTRVRIAVPNCEDHDLVMWVFCQTSTFENGNATVEAPMIRYVIARGLNLAETSHGILGQFWNIPINVVRYNEQIRGEVRTDAYTITVNYPGQQRQFVGFLYPLNWELKENWCLYVGNRQGGPINEVDNPNDPVLQGEYSDYKVDSIFGTEYAFGHFESARCMA